MRKIAQCFSNNKTKAFVLLLFLFFSSKHFFLFFFFFLLGFLIPKICPCSHPWRAAQSKDKWYQSPVQGRRRCSKTRRCTRCGVHTGQAHAILHVEVEHRRLHYRHQEVGAAKTDAESSSSAGSRRRPPLCSTRCWRGPTTTSGLCWCVSTCKRKGYDMPSSRRKKKWSSTERIDWRSPPYCRLCLWRCWRLSPPSVLRNPTELVCSECGSPISSSCRRSSRRSASRMANPSIIFPSGSWGSPTSSPLLVEASVRQRSWKDATGRPRSPRASRDFNRDIAWHEQPNGGRNNRKVAQRRVEEEECHFSYR